MSLIEKEIALKTDPEDLLQLCQISPGFEFVCHQKEFWIEYYWRRKRPLPEEPPSIVQYFVNDLTLNQAEKWVIYLETLNYIGHRRGIEIKQVWKLERNQFENLGLNQEDLELIFEFIDDYDLGILEDTQFVIFHDHLYLYMEDDRGDLYEKEIDLIRQQTKKLIARLLSKKITFYMEGTNDKIKIFD